MLDCAQINEALNQFGSCDKTEFGNRVVTHCLYPSFEPVSVIVVSSGSGYEVHENGGAVKSAWLHGRDRSALGRALSKSARSYGCEFKNDVIYARVSSVEWLYSGILSVANATADAARVALGKEADHIEIGLVDRTKNILDNANWYFEL